MRFLSLREPPNLDLPLAIWTQCKDRMVFYGRSCSCVPDKAIEGYIWNHCTDAYRNIKVAGSSFTTSANCTVERTLVDHPKKLLGSPFRTWGFQQTLYKNKTAAIRALGYSEQDARAIAATSVAVPGTSEHQLGLAVDIVDSGKQNPTVVQPDITAQQCLMEYCWNYGFILRYAADKTEITGGVYEPWHYRYVGREAAKEIQESGLCLEEYLEQNKEETAEHV